MFRSVGSGVRTVCFQCGGCLSWEESDDPFVEHDHWFPNCYYIKSYKMRKAAYACIPHRTERLSSPSRDVNFSNLDLSLVSDRLKTFDSWPVPFISKQELAAAGFYYTQRNDRVLCYYCNIDVGNWEVGDDPFGEHIKHSPNCRHSSFCRMMLQKKAGGAETSQTSDPTLKGKVILKHVKRFPPDFGRLIENILHRSRHLRPVRFAEQKTSQVSSLLEHRKSIKFVQKLAAVV